jgi:cysteine desulfurase/selenocysteine lyase
MSQSSHSWEQFREQFPVARRWAYFDNAAVAPLSQPAFDALSKWSSEALHEGDTVWPQWSEGVEQTRGTAAKLLGADQEEIAIIPNTTHGIGLVAEGFPWRDGDNVVILDNEFPSNVYPWLNLTDRGVTTRRVSVEGGVVDLDRLADACDSRTRILSISWIGYATGWRINVAEIVEFAHARNVLVFLDAIQGLGVFPLDVHQTGVDFLSADGHKWMVSPEGAGLFYARREHLSHLRPLGVGWHSVVHSHDFAKLEYELRPTAARYEGGSQNMSGVLALGASLQLLADFGLSSESSPIADRVLEMTDLICQRLEEIGAQIASHRIADRRSGIVAFDMPGQSPAALRSRCIEAGVVLSCRGDYLRISPHAYIDETDIDRLIDTLSEP